MTLGNQVNGCARLCSEAQRHSYIFTNWSTDLYGSPLREQGDGKEGRTKPQAPPKMTVINYHLCWPREDLYSEFSANHKGT